MAGVAAEQAVARIEAQAELLAEEELQVVPGVEAGVVDVTDEGTEKVAVQAEQVEIGQKKRQVSALP